MGSDLVVCSLEAWDQVWRRNQYLITELRRADPTLRVLFVEPPLDPLYELRRGLLPRLDGRLRAVPVTVPAQATPEVGALWTLRPTKWLPRVLGPLSERSLTTAVRSAARHLGFRRPLLWVNDPAGAALLQATGWPALYDITDDWLHAEQTDRARKRLLANEEILLRRCEEVVVCSPGLAASKGTRRAVHLIPNAVDVAAYRRPRPRPGDLPPGRYALYAGTLHTDRIDIELCVATARGLTGRGRLVLLGPDLLPAHVRERLAGEASIVVLGIRDHRQVPAYLQHADALVVPHLVTAFTESLDPIKRYEYQAVGRPVVATPVAGFRDFPGADVLSGADFVAAVVARLSADPLPPGPGPICDSVPSWRDRAATMASVLDRLA